MVVLSYGILLALSIKDKGVCQNVKLLIFER